MSTPLSLQEPPVSPPAHSVPEHPLITYKALQSHNRHCWCPAYISRPCHLMGHAGQPSNCWAQFPDQGSSGLCTPPSPPTAGWQNKELTPLGSYPPAEIEGSWWINTPGLWPLGGTLPGVCPALAPRISLRIGSQEDGDRPPPHPPNVAVHLGDLLRTWVQPGAGPAPSAGMWSLKLGSKKQWPEDNNCLHRLTTTKD